MPDVDEVNSEKLAELRQLRNTPELLQQLQHRSGSELSIQQQLRSQFDAHLVPAAIALHAARQKAAKILPCGDRLWLTRVGLEQATTWQVAQHKAQRFPTDEPVVDLCSGIGVDTAALLTSHDVMSVDLDPTMAQRSEWNVEEWRDGAVIGRHHSHQQAVSDAGCVSIAGKLIHADPDRRAGRDRPVKRLELYRPNLTWMQQATQVAQGGALKLGPASNFIQKFPDCQIELISVSGECREATVWFGSLAEECPFRATILPSGESIAADPLSSWCETTSQLDTFLFNPDPAVVRSGLLDTVGVMHNLQRLDREDEYLTGAQVPATGFVTPFRVEAVLPNKVRELKRYFRNRPARNYEIKCRHLHVDAGVIQKKLPRGDGQPKVILFVRIAGKAARGGCGKDGILVIFS